MAAEQPKRPLSSYFLYLDENRAAIQKRLGDAAKEKGIISKTGAEDWRKLSDAEKEPYLKKAEALKKDFEKAIEAFKAGGGEVAPRGSKRKAEKDEKKKKKKDKDAPKKPSGGGYGQFISEKRKEIVEGLPKGSNQITDVAKVAGTRWKALSEAEQKPYADKFVSKMAEYKIAIEAYKATKPAEEESEEEEEEEAKESPAKKAKTDAKGGAKASAKDAKKADKEPTKAKKDVAKKEPPKKATAKAKKEAAKKEAPKKGAANSKKAPEPVGVALTDALIKKAAGLGMETALRNLAKRDAIVNKNFSGAKLLTALEGNDGLVNKAKFALLGA